MYTKETMLNVNAIVIGSGFGGIACALHLLKMGFKVTLLEKNDKPGGRAYVYEDQGFIFDAGPTVITAPYLLEELFALFQEKLPMKMFPIEPFYKLSWPNGVEFDYTNDEEKLKKQIIAFNPKDWENYQRFYEYSQNVFKEGYTKLVDKPFIDLCSMFKCAPKLIQLSAYRSVYAMVSAFIENENLRQAFSFHALLVGGSPFRASSIYTLIHYLERKWAVFFPEGGVHHLVRSLVNLLQRHGGTFRNNATVDEIIVDQGKVKGVQLQSGEFLSANIVVSNADVVHTYDYLLKNQKLSARNKALKSTQSMSLVVIYFGVSKKYPKQAHHHVIFGPRYRELLEDIFERGILADDFSLYLHAPTVTDPSLAPPGCEAFYVLSPVPHLGKAPIDWKIEGEKYANRILDFLDAHYLPELKQHLIVKRVFTPLDFKEKYFAHFGSAFSIEPTLLQSAYFRTHNRDPQLKGLYFVGAGTHPGAGLPGVLNSAKATSRLVEQDALHR
jgi:phytoene desaturase